MDKYFNILENLDENIKIEDSLTNIEVIKEYFLNNKDFIYLFPKIEQKIINLFDEVSNFYFKNINKINSKARMNLSFENVIYSNEFELENVQVYYIAHYSIEKCLSKIQNFLQVIELKEGNNILLIFNNDIEIIKYVNKNIKSKTKFVVCEDSDFDFFEPLNIIDIQENNFQENCQFKYFKVCYNEKKI